MNKRELRKKILNIRNNMNKEDVVEKSKIIMQKIINTEAYKKSNTIFIYMDFKNEVITSFLINQMISENKSVMIPYTDVENINIIPVEIHNLEQDLKRCSFGYLEPKKELITPVDLKIIDLIIVPGVVFDRKLNRIGFGKGYYDRILSKKRSDTKAIAIAYEFQVLNEIPHEEHDIKMDMIVTEEKIYN
ncbi:5-formyltetrahydrofolate cyclo-ligase [Sedimentibacter sp. MB31-C6]|uniref:5-formyltetrahydrofolate cyclo-ligase n=1 Tax=Sedimentibacter sp. MB31-C6 TaxID=3109366 RepID=UPI002DDD201E|nr:5-formyltetrahydrofolate cyclo-ligase [Sedimentibacter sp. MB36-C1]WSI05517.1 5-formyltetrahydrofolate cyclo-ligase [Sedimentibacter sp. MB36-C1]